jgi:23S rRNA (cytosine1962-C5)-methyltransferase
MNETISLTIRRERLGPVLGRHPWVFSGALAGIPDGIKSGTPVKLYDDSRRFIAQGYFGSYSQIAVRIWSYDEDEIVNGDFFLRRIEKAFALRKSCLDISATDSFRLVNAENDFLPGLIVDKYADYLVVQFHTAGLDLWREEIVSALVKVLKPKGIYERSDISARGLDGETKRTGVLFGEVPEKIEIKENGFKFFVDVIGGQKTGFFLDQRDKRQALMKYCKGKKVLNCFSYTGGFSVYALAAGATKVVSVDASESAIALAKENVVLNDFSLDKCEFVCDDVKKYLRQLSLGDFDVIILDPPAFIKDRRKIKEGITGYRFINEAALHVMRPGSVLVSASCSAHLKLTDFRYLLTEAAGRAGKSLQILETHLHGQDHPELISFNEGEYLKCLFMEVS